MSESSERVVHLACGLVAWDRRGVVLLRLGNSHPLTLEEARAMVDASFVVARGEGQRILVDLRGGNPATREARDYFASEGLLRRDNTARVALLVPSVVSRTIGNFYLRVQRPRIPTKMFGDETQAIRWLIDDR